MDAVSSHILIRNTIFWSRPDPDPVALSLLSKMSRPAVPTKVPVYLPARGAQTGGHTSDGKHPSELTASAMPCKYGHHYQDDIAIHNEVNLDGSSKGRQVHGAVTANGKR